jgi:hypothetical protein
VEQKRQAMDACARAVRSWPYFGIRWTGGRPVGNFTSAYGEKSAVSEDFIGTCRASKPSRFAQK